MIKEILLNNIATFTQPTSIIPTKINFFYGCNGSGKTTISNVIADEAKYTDMVKWDITPMRKLVYNRNFIESNFGETSNIGGIFTLGKDSKEAQDYIAEQRAIVDEYDRELDRHKNSKEKLIKEQQRREDAINDSCWRIKSKHGNEFSVTFAGLNNSKFKFRDRCISEVKKKKQVLLPVEEIKRLYKTAFSGTRTIYTTYALIDDSNNANLYSCDLLAKKVTGSSDTPIGEFIEYLGSSDWIKAGIPYAIQADGKCPFCQQDLSQSIFDDIKSFFDETYEHVLQEIRAFKSNYAQSSYGIMFKLRECVNNPLPMLDYSLLKTEVDGIALLIDKNIGLIENKIIAPSTEISLDSLSQSIGRINDRLTAFNEIINESNDAAKYQKTKQEECNQNVWQLVISELNSELDTYIRDTYGYVTGCRKLDEKSRDRIGKKENAIRLISEKEKTITSVRPTAEAINTILTRFGFEGFSIDENANKPGTYRIVRNDGKRVDKSLSEGEYNFISFLYFYHLVYGSQDKIGISQSKIVVIDDPISSLDSNVIFIISTLTKQIISDCRKGNWGVKQVIILTHNVYFHKEVTYIRYNEKWSEKEASFWIIKKKNNVSQIINYKSENPIQTSYELLWSELKNADSNQRITIFNTLRRILEYYFNVIGGLDYEKCINKFDGEDKMICKSLIVCINEGSHFITDDFVMQYESSAMENYIRVFKLIFFRMGQISHYNMMMDIIDVSETTEEVQSYG